MGKDLPEIDRLEVLKGLVSAHNVRTLIFKRLAPNDNSKNQIYLGGDWSSLQLLPFGEVTTDESRRDSKRDRFKADLAFFWMDDAGVLSEAPGAQLILYPKYPEIRMSGFLQGTRSAPRRHLNSRDEGRILFLGITGDRRIIGHVIGAGNPLGRELAPWITEKVFSEIPLERPAESSRLLLLNRLREIHEAGWVESVKLDGSGRAQPYKARNGGGYTLEALLGIAPNGRNEPDYLGWEVKQHACRLDEPLSAGAITLMTPEPSGGYYRTQGVIDFVRTFGYPDVSGKVDRLNFGGTHKFGERHVRTGLVLRLTGYDPGTRKITDIKGGVSLLSEDGVEAAIWHFSSLLGKWNKKHAQAVYVPSEKQAGDAARYRYGHVVALGTGTDFGKFLNAIAARAVYYDPGIKVENISTVPKAKKRSQFRIRPSGLPALYDRMEIVDLLE